jgi:hypothetical protein
MTAFAIDTSHIDVMLSLAIHGPADQASARRWYPPWVAEIVGVDSALTRELADPAGVALLRENVLSCRASAADTPGAFRHLFAAAAAANQFEWTDLGRSFTVIEGMRAVAFYEQASGVHCGWEGSGPQTICNRLRAALSEQLPGYDEAPSHWTADAALARARRCGCSEVV